MRDFDVCGLGNAIVDIFLEVDEAEFQSLGFERGTMRLVGHDEQKLLLERFHDSRRDLKLVSGGSVANSIIGLTQLGGRGAFIGCVGDDRYGMHYSDEFENLKIEIGNPILFGETTGTCVALITPDAERTMRTCLAVSSELSARHVDADRIRRSTWLFIEGYVFANADTGQHAIREAIKVAKEAGTKIALTCSDAFIPEVFGDAFREALAESDLIFCNAPEAMAVTQTKSSDEAFKALSKMVQHSIVTDGANGAYIQYEEVTAHIPAFDCHPKDLTGAGDMFAGAFLYGITHGYLPKVAAQGANYLAMKVISQVGARLHQGVPGFWKEGVA